MERQPKWLLRLTISYIVYQCTVDNTIVRDVFLAFVRVHTSCTTQSKSLFLGSK